MDNRIKKSIIKSTIGLFVALLLIISSNLKIPILDSTADNYFKESITKAGVAYASCRIVNASISVIKESDLSLEPAGIGISIALGQALDPIDDMTERLSNVLVTAITALGVQKLAYEISRSLAFPTIGFLLIITSLLIWVEQKWVEKINRCFIKIVLIILIARFCLPISSMANDFLHSHFFDEQITTANNELSYVTKELDKLKEFTLPETNGIIGTFSNSASYLKQKTYELKDAITVTLNNMGEIIENLLKLTFLYVSVFIFQVIILPVVVFWGLIKGMDSLLISKN